VGMESTITDGDLDASSRQFVESFRQAEGHHPGAPDLDVDGLSDSILSRLLGLFGFDRK
jgi:hypothetical protein